MTKLLFVGDIHWDCVTPISRKDDYPNAVLGKMEQVDRIAVKHKVDKVICVGDVFNRKNITLSSLAHFIDVRRKALDKYKIEWITIAGNHDLYYGRKDTLQDTPLGILLASDVFIFSRPIFSLIDGVVISLFDYDRNSVLADNNFITGKHIGVVHKYINPQYASDPDYLDVAKLKGYGFIVAGHDHNRYDTETIGNTVVIRPGALTRKTSSTEDMEREVCVAVLEITPNSYNLIYEPIEIQPSAEVYSEVKLAAKEDKRDLKAVIEELVKAPVTSSDGLGVLKELTVGHEKAVFNTSVEYAREFNVL
jgi:DNA repair exonuclease SbcCD nuclease subunit